MKQCTKCKKIKQKSDFSKNKRYRDGLFCWCKKCMSLAKINHYRSKKGLIRKIYKTQLASSIKRKHNPPNYTLEQLEKWVFGQDNFEKLYQEWVESEYCRNKVPSIDRISNDLPYTFENIQLMNWRENDLKAHKETFDGKLIVNHTKVFQYTLEGELINSFISQSQASRETKVHQGLISMCCNNKRQTACGFRWSFYEAV